MFISPFNLSSQRNAGQHYARLFNRQPNSKDKPVLFNSDLQSASIPQPSSEQATLINITLDGLPLSVSISPGPYFLSELIAISMTLHNTSHTTYDIAGDFTPQFCTGRALQAILTGGADPSFAIPADSRGPRCPPPDGTLLWPDQSGTQLQYVPLLHSGQLTLHVYSSIATVSSSQPVTPTTLAIAQLSVSPHIPADRIISLQGRGADQRIIVPQPARIQLLYRSARLFIGNTNCTTYSWVPLAAPLLRTPGSACTRGPGGPFYYAVGAVGYAVVTGVWKS